MTANTGTAASASDLTKLQNEILMILNQQFLIVLAALAFFGTSVAVLLPEKLVLTMLPGDKPEDIPLVVYLAAILIPLVLALLGFWISQLNKIVVAISVYLDLRGLSQWEDLYHEYERRRSRVGRDVAHLVIFETLGTAALALPIIVSLHRGYNAPTNAWFLWLLVCLAGYWYAMWSLLAKQDMYRDRVRGRWDQVLRQRGLL